MTLSGLWTRKSPKGKRQEAPPPRDVREPHWTQLKSKLRARRGHAADRSTSLDAKASAKTPTHHCKRDLLLQIISPRPSVHPPRPSTPSSPYPGAPPAPASAVYSSSYRQVSQDRPFALPSQCEHVSVGPTGAGVFGVALSTDCHARDLDFEENVREPVDARSSEQFPTVPSANAEVTPLGELSPPFAPESSDASPLYGCELASEYLSAASICQARRWRLRAQINRARLIAQDLADSDFPLQNLEVLDLAVPAEAEPAALDGYASASGSFESAAAPVPSDSGLNEASSGSIVHIAPADVQVTNQPQEVHESADTETINFHSKSRDSVGSSSSSHSLFAYDHIISDPPSDAENSPPSLSAAEDSDVGSERSLYDPVLQCFSFPPRVNEVSSAENDARNIEKERIESARVKAEFLNAAAPIPPTRVSGSENCKLVIRVTPPTPPVTMRPTYRQRNQSIHAGEVNLQNYLVPPDPRRSKSRSTSDHLGPVSGETGMLSATPSADHYSKVVAGSVEIPNGGVTAQVRSDTRFASRHLRTIQAFGSSATLVDRLPPSADINILRTSGLVGDDFHVVYGQDMSAGDEAEPSSSDAPILSTPVPPRKPTKATGFSGGLVPGRSHQQSRSLKSRIASSLREWGNVASRLFTANRSSNVGETQTFSPFFDPWNEGYIPPRGPSPDPVQPEVDFGPPQPSIQNVYIKLD